ncbi:slipin family protein, partial [Streptomyces endophyticus]|nr:slipin family protein [Streptomyces endophyticus]
QTVVAVAAEKNSTLVLPFPVELLRFLERATPGDAEHAARAAVTQLAEGALPGPAETPAPAPAFEGKDASGVPDPTVNGGQAGAKSGQD